MLSRDFVADTLALVLFFTVTSGLNERFVAGMDWAEVAVSRGIGAPLMILTARPYSLWRNAVMRRFAPKGAIATTLVDGLALLLFQVPIYAAIIFAGGARGEDLFSGTAGFAALMLILGRPYGLWLAFVRARLGLEGPGRKPMSLGG